MWHYARESKDAAVRRRCMRFQPFPKKCFRRFSVWGRVAHGGERRIFLQHLLFFHATCNNVSLVACVNRASVREACEALVLASPASLPSTAMAVFAVQGAFRNHSSKMTREMCNFHVEFRRCMTRAHISPMAKFTRFCSPRWQRVQQNLTGCVHRHSYVRPLGYRKSGTRRTNPPAPGSTALRLRGESLDECFV